MRRSTPVTQHDQIPPRFPALVSLPSLTPSESLPSSESGPERPATLQKQAIGGELETLFTTLRLTALQHPRFICARSPIGRRRTLLHRTAIDSASDIITVPRAAVSYDGGPARRCKAGGEGERGGEGVGEGGKGGDRERGRE